jgi:hypothetical protein
MISVGLNLQPCHGDSRQMVLIARAAINNKNKAKLSDPQDTNTPSQSSYLLKWP